MKKYTVETFTTDSGPFYMLKGPNEFYTCQPEKPELQALANAGNFFDILGLNRSQGFLTQALNAYWNQAHNELQRKDLGDIERKNLEYQRDKSKEWMDLLESL